MRQHNVWCVWHGVATGIEKYATTDKRIVDICQSVHIFSVYTFGKRFLLCNAVMMLAII